MQSAFLLHHLVFSSFQRDPQRIALTHDGVSLSYEELSTGILGFAEVLTRFGLGRQERVAVYLEKRFETVIGCFGTACAGQVFVPINPLLKPGQVGHILQDCTARVLLTSGERLPQLRETLEACRHLEWVIVVDPGPETPSGGRGFQVHEWSRVVQPTARLESVRQNFEHPVGAVPCTDQDMVAILYTSGSTGKPKGVVLSHRNMVAGAKSVASYLENSPGDTLLAALPLSFDAGFSQLTTAFHAGARVVLINYLLPKDVLNAVVVEKVTGLTAVPPLWIHLSRLKWPASVPGHLRYVANTGGRMPLETLNTLRASLPGVRPFLMYGLTEAFRSTYLPPEEVDRRPDSIGRAIPNAEILVLREDGTPCAPNEPGELVHRGALVGLGYWNDLEKTAERYRPLPAGVRGGGAGLPLPEMAVFSGDIVRVDEEGYLYFIGRRDEMIKTSGYRVSPVEIEEIVYGARVVDEAAAFGIPHPALGQAIVVVAAVTTPRPQSAPELQSLVLAACRASLPLYMLPAHVVIRDRPLPRNPNGKIDRRLLAAEFESSIQNAAAQ